MQIQVEGGATIKVEGEKVLVNGILKGRGFVAFCPPSINDPHTLNPEQISEKPQIGGSLIVFSDGLISYQSPPIENFGGKK